METVHTPAPDRRCCCGPEQQAWRHAASHQIQSVFSLVGTSSTWSDTPGTNILMVSLFIAHFKHNNISKQIVYSLKVVTETKQVYSLAVTISEKACTFSKYIFSYLQCCCIDALCQVSQVFQETLVFHYIHQSGVTFRSWLQPKFVHLG